MLGPGHSCINSIFSNRLECAVQIFSTEQNCLPQYESAGRFLAISHYGPIRVVPVSNGLDFKVYHNKESKEHMVHNISIITTTSKIICKNQILNFEQLGNETRLVIQKMKIGKSESTYQRILNSDLNQVLGETNSITKNIDFLSNHSLQDAADFLTFQRNQRQILPFVPPSFHSSIVSFHSLIIIFIALFIISSCLYCFFLKIRRFFCCDATLCTSCCKDQSEKIKEKSEERRLVTSARSRQLPEDIIGEINTSFV